LRLVAISIDRWHQWCLGERKGFHPIYICYHLLVICRNIVGVCVELHLSQTALVVKGISSVHMPVAYILPYSAVFSQLHVLSLPWLLCECCCTVASIAAAPALRKELFVPWNKWK
jgi:hypothetical protein